MRISNSYLAFLAEEGKLSTIAPGRCREIFEELDMRCGTSEEFQEDEA